MFRVTERLANSSVRTVMGIRIIASRFSVTRNLTCKGLPSGIQKIVVMKCLLEEKMVSTCCNCQLSNASCYHQVDVEWSQLGSFDKSRFFLNRFVHAHNLCWRRFLEKAFDKCEICRFWRTRKCNFFPSLEFFSVDFWNF